MIIFCALSIIAAVASGKTDDLSSSMISAFEDSVSLFLSLLGVMAFWGGVMNIAKKSGLTDKISRLLSPVLKLIFKGVSKTSAAFSAITLNITANMLGLANAATPLGIEAMTELKNAEGGGETPTKNIALLTLFNTASIQIIPTTIAAIRGKYESANPMEIIPSVLITSFLSLMVGIAAVNILYINRKRKRYERN